MPNEKTIKAWEIHRQMRKHYSLNHIENEQHKPILSGFLWDFFPVFYYGVPEHYKTEWTIMDNIQQLDSMLSTDGESLMILEF